MRATCALGLLFLSGCAAGMQQHAGEPFLDPGPKLLHINGTFEPVAFVVTRGQGGPADERPKETILRPRRKVPRSSGTAEPKVPPGNGTAAPSTIVQTDTYKIVVTGRGACQTNDPMPNGRTELPAGTMPRSHPLHVAPMPNACPVTVPWSTTTVFTAIPRPTKIVPAQQTTEPRP